MYQNGSHFLHARILSLEKTFSKSNFGLEYLDKRMPPSANVPSSFKTPIFFAFSRTKGKYRVTISRRFESLAFSIVSFSIRRPRADPRSALRTCARRSDLSTTSLLLFSWPWQCVSRADGSILYSLRFDGVLAKRYPFWVPIRLSQTAPCNECDRYMSQTRHCETLRRHWNAEAFQTIVRSPFLT